MKKLLFLLSVLLCVDAAAQMLPDSSVMIMGHWKKGLTMSYKMSRSNYKIIDNDTTEFRKTDQTLVFKVLKAKKDSYKIRLSTHDYELSGDDPNGVYGAMAALKGSDILFTTDAYGSLVSIDNMDQIREEGLQAVRVAVDAAQQNKGQVLPPEAISYIEKMVTDPAAIKQALTDYMKIFCFHGMHMEIGEVLEYDTQIPSILPGVATLLDAKGKVYLDSELTDSESAVGHVHIYSDGESAMKFLSDSMKGLQKGLNAEHLDQVIDSFADMKYEELLSIEIYLPAGIPIQSYYDKYVDLVIDGVRVRSGQSESVELL